MDNLTSVEALKTRIQEIAQRTITRKVIEELKNNKDLHDWAKRGLSLHQDRETCAFCNSKIEDGRIEDLNAFFNDAYNTLETDIDNAVSEIQSLSEKIRGFTPFDEERLFPVYRNDYKNAVQKLRQDGVAMINSLKLIAESLQQKKAKSFEAVSVNGLTDLDTQLAEHRQAVKSVNSVIQSHNDHCENRDDMINTAKEAIKKHHASSIYSDYTTEVTAIDDLAEQERVLKEDEIPPLTTQCEDFERLLKSHYPALKTINDLLKVFMGRTDIVLEPNEDEGYTIKRNGRIAKNLSEGEKTAIAFCFFISKMDEDGFDIKNSIVVVDDPISSLDTNALYAAGAFIRRNLENANQLFILTHNHRFFREMYGWLVRKKSKHVSNLMIKCQTDENGKRKSTLSSLDPLLEEYDNEYVYFCKLLFKASNDLPQEIDETPTDEILSRLILLPNVARKVMETFLLFKYPGDVKAGERAFSIFKKGSPFVDKLGQDKLSVLDRLLDRGSHGDGARMAELNIPDLSETRKVIQYVLDFIEAADEEHYKQLQMACGEEMPINDNAKEEAA